MKLAEAHLGLTNIDGSRSDLEHGTALISTIGVVAKLNFGQVRHILPLLLQATAKWCTQYISALDPKVCILNDYEIISDGLANFNIYKFFFSVFSIKIIRILSYIIRLNIHRLRESKNPIIF